MTSPLAIYCDFDGTITQGDTIDFILARLADPEWEVIEREWVEGRIGSRECLARQIPLIRGGWQAIQRLLSEVRFDPTFAAFAQWCHRKGIPLMIVSEGIEQVIRFLLAREEIVVSGIQANRLNEAQNGSLSLDFPLPPVQPECLSGLCKCLVLSPKTELRQVVIGDGFSDRCWAQQADMLFAKSKLQLYCQQHNIRYQPFENFASIQKQLEDHLTQFRHVKFGNIEWEPGVACTETFQRLKSLSVP